MNELENFIRNLFWVTFVVFRNAHAEQDHPSIEQTLQQFEATFINENGLRLILVLIQQNCVICEERTRRKYRRKPAVVRRL